MAFQSLFYAVLDQKDQTKVKLAIEISLQIF